MDNRLLAIHNTDEGQHTSHFKLNSNSRP